MNYVIIGNSTAAIGAVEGIRAYDREGSITLITNEPHHTYSRPLISYLLLGKTTEEGMRYREADFYEKNGCTLLCNRTATGIDAAKKRVTLADGESVSYDKLLVATGSSPFVPPMEGLETVEHKTTFGSLDDAKALEAMITPQSRVLIVGAGLIGLKCAEGIRDRVQSQSLTVVDLAPRVLSSILDDQASDLIRAHLEAQGIRFFLGQSVSAFAPDSATLTGGETVGFDVLVLAVGVRANTALVKDAGGAVGRGITVNLHMEATLPDVYSAGDCTESEDCSTGTIKIMALLPNAYMQGKCAGSRMAGADVCFDKAIPMNSIGLFGLHMMTAGTYEGEVYEEADGQTLKKLFYSHNRLRGFILIGDIRRAGIYTSMIRERTPLDSVDFALLCKHPGLMAFSKETRAEKLGGGVK